MFGLALLFVHVFLPSFKHFDHLAWGRGSWYLCLACICLLAMHTLIWVTFSLPLVSGVGCDFCLWLFLDFYVYLLSTVHGHVTFGQNFQEDISPHTDVKKLSGCPK